ncbi:MotA/TolQ/ExbB proton channel family protein [Longimicrobium terrae]|uniref:MotA/TolQ/ExbB proton channel domain-containing protein n=1 Tax=Longimicrobium terrae TaxID=1639882 RepID=A0A841GQ75_9BACT|nr:MotA/TolQ/ExbB proton channel family protein [Longimicrobium terrae]MBB4634775.1 hypothetical protein [Longimicrobium terrae]MBB6069170.1 hypothetical protein [Longimicrobium terrae]NNC32014.1 hypothetical protein [Longimicrobium terrae]
MQTVLPPPEQAAVYPPAAAAATEPDAHVSVPRPAQGGTGVPVALLAGAALTAATHFALQPFRGSYLAVLLLERGWMQYASVFLACTALVLLAGRAAHAFAAHRDLAGAARLPALTAAEARNRVALVALRERWARAGGRAGLLRARALQAYLVSGSASAAAAASDDDTAQAEAALEGAYSVPRVAVWAIPLFGFIGTVVGISAAVAGFSGFLQKAEEIEQIKQGIGGVTTGLAVAFDTTLLALALSVAVMLPLVLLERWERRAILALDADTRDQVIARLPGADAARPAGVDEQTMHRVVEHVVRGALPSPEAMVRDARTYLQSAAAEIAGAAQDAARAVGEAGQALAQAQAENRALAEQEQAAARARLEARDERVLRTLVQTARALLAEQNAAAVESRAQIQAAGEQFAATVNTVSSALHAGAAALGQRAEQLAALAAQTSEVVALEQSLHRSIDALRHTGRLQEILGEVEISLRALRPALDRLALPRTITLVEADGDVRPVGNHGDA